MKKNSVPVAHHDIEVRMHLAHLHVLHAQRTGMPLVLPSIFKAAQEKREKQKKPVKAITTIRLSQKVLDAFKATGKGWQTRMNDILCEIVEQGKI